MAPVETSSLRQADHGPGEYFVCLRETAIQIDKQRLTYSVFFDDTYKSSRLAVILEHCEQQKYFPMN